MSTMSNADYIDPIGRIVVGRYSGWSVSVVARGDPEYLRGILETRGNLNTNDRHAITAELKASATKPSRQCNKDIM